MAEEDSTVVGLIFSATTQKFESFQSLSTGIVLHINWTISSADGFNPITHQLLDQTSPSSTTPVTPELPESSPTGRVFRFTTTLGRPLSLLECKHITDSERILLLQTQNNVEVILQPGELFRRHRTPGLAVFDMDSTLIQQEVIDELARAVGKYDAVAAITAAAMRGEEPYTDFAASLRARVKLLEGVRSTIWEEMKGENGGIITFMPGAKELLRALGRLGWKTAVLSGGFVNLAEWVKATLGMDYMFANQLMEDAERRVLTGDLVPGAAIVDGARKRDLLAELAARDEIPLTHTIAVGDGSNDLPMMGVAGLGIAMHAKPKVQAVAPCKLNLGTLVDVLYILGFNGEEVAKLTAP